MAHFHLMIVIKFFLKKKSAKIFQVFLPVKIELLELRKMTQIHSKQDVIAGFRLIV